LGSKREFALFGLMSALASCGHAAVSAYDRVGKVEDGRGSLGPCGNARFPSPLIEPDVRISRIRLSDWLHRQAHERNQRPQASSARREFFLRITTQLSLMNPDLVGVCRLIANHLHLAIFESTPEVRALPSAGITQLHRSYDPVRLPPMPPPEATLRPLPSHQTGLPRLPEPPFRRAAPTTPAD
jgi:hypothetical protein